MARVKLQISKRLQSEAWKEGHADCCTFDSYHGSFHRDLGETDPATIASDLAGFRGHINKTEVMIAGDPLTSYLYDS